MAKDKLPNATQICEDILRHTIHYNIEHKILPSEIAVAEMLLDRSIELSGAYAEIQEKLGHHPHAVEILLATLLSTAAFWKPSDVSEAREGRKRLAKVNEDIAFHAGQLRELFEERDQLHNHSRFASDTHYHVCDVIEAAAEHNFRFRMDVQEKLKALHYQYDLKYWPSLSDFMGVLEIDAHNAEIDATDPLTAAATSGSRSGRSDFLKALYAAIEENSGENFGQIPREFHLTDASIASLATCALGLDPDRPIDGPGVKRFRQRVRATAKGLGNSR